MRRPTTWWLPSGAVLAVLTVLAFSLGPVSASASPGSASPRSASPGLAPVGAAAARPSHPPVDLGPNVKVFDPSMSTSEIRAAVDAVYERQVDAEMGTGRYALLFKPGVYGSADDPLILRVGYYTEVAG